MATSKWARETKTCLRRVAPSTCRHQDAAPGELQELARRKHAKLRELSSELDRFMQSEASERKRRDNTRELTPDVEEKLRALGYIE